MPGPSAPPAPTHTAPAAHPTPRGFAALMGAQFVSALADNALIIVAVALLQAQGRPAWWVPLVKFAFTLAYVLLAPWIGPLADAFRKGRLMLAMNTLKAAGLLALLGGAHPLAALAVVGVGAAAYAPAKYGLVTEMVAPQRLVWANGWIEVTTVCAVLVGTALGGALVGAPAAAWFAHAWPALGPLPSALAALLALYALAALLNLGVPDSGARYRRPRRRGAWPLLQRFRSDNLRLWRDAEGGLSMAVTTLFWGSAAALQFAVLRWASDSLGLPLDQAAYLQATVATGVIGGAALAGRWVPLAAAPRVMPLGIVLGLVVPLAAAAASVAQALPLLLLVGALGGAMVVPMNALLQHRGHRRLSAGRSIAVQGFNENLSVLVMLAGYAALLAAGTPVDALMAALGLFVAAVMALLCLGWARRGGSGPRRPAGQM